MGWGGEVDDGEECGTLATYVLYMGWANKNSAVCAVLYLGLDFELQRNEVQRNPPRNPGAVSRSGGPTPPPPHPTPRHPPTPPPVGSPPGCVWEQDAALYVKG